MKYRNPLELDSYIKGKLIDNNKEYYIFIDEIQKSETIKNPFIDGVDSKINFVDVLIRLMKIPNVDLYVTESNSKMLSSEIITEFKDRGTKFVFILCLLKNFMIRLKAIRIMRGKNISLMVECH